MTSNEKYINKIRMQYMEHIPSDIDTLRALDAKVKRPATIFSYVFGSISAVVTGCGMSFVMTDIGKFVGLENAMMPGVIIGCVGMGLALLTYPIYSGMIKSRKKKYGGKIIELSDKILNK